MTFFKSKKNKCSYNVYCVKIFASSQNTTQISYLQTAGFWFYDGLKAAYSIQSLHPGSQNTWPEFIKQQSKGSAGRLRKETETPSNTGTEPSHFFPNKIPQPGLKAA
jgi:hypothetical protein